MTETQLLQPIEWDQVRVGDVIRAERHCDGVGVFLSGPVVEVNVLTDQESVSLGESRGRCYTLGKENGYSLTLISRPAPERPVGSLWWHEVSETGWVATDSKGYPYRVFKGDHGGITWLHPEPDHDFIDALVPYPPEPAQPDPVLCLWPGHSSHTNSSVATPKATPARAVYWTGVVFALSVLAVVLIVKAVSGA